VSRIFGAIFGGLGFLGFFGDNGGLGLGFGNLPVSRPFGLKHSLFTSSSSHSKPPTAAFCPLRAPRAAVTTRPPHLACRLAAPRCCRLGRRLPPQHRTLHTRRQATSNTLRYDDDLTINQPPPPPRHTLPAHAPAPAPPPPPLPMLTHSRTMKWSASGASPSSPGAPSFSACLAGVCQWPEGKWGEASTGCTASLT